MSDPAAISLTDLLDRLERASKSLLGLAGEANCRGHHQEKWRLEAKAEGVRLAASYVREAAHDD